MFRFQSSHQHKFQRSGLFFYALQTSSAKLINELRQEIKAVIQVLVKDTSHIGYFLTRIYDVYSSLNSA